MQKISMRPIIIVRVSSGDIKNGLPYIDETPTLGEQYTRTFLLRKPNRIFEGLKPADLAGIEVPVTRANMTLPGLKAVLRKARKEEDKALVRRIERRIRTLDYEVRSLKAWVKRYRRNGKIQKAFELQLKVEELESRGVKRADLLYVKEYPDSLHFFVVETKDALPRNEETNELMKAKEQAKRNGELLRKFLKERKDTRSCLITPVLVGIEYSKGSPRGFILGAHFKEIEKEF